MNVCGVQTVALVDTGASRTLMTKALYYKLPVNKHNLYPSHVNLASYTGHHISVLGETTVPIGHRKGLRVLVVDGVEDTPLLIGNDSLQQAGSVIDYLTNTVTISGHRYPMISRRDALYKVSQVSELPVVSDKVLRQIVQRHKDVFGKPGTLGECTLPPITIDTGDAPPIKQKAYRLPLAKLQEVEQHVTEMLDLGVIRPSMSPWASPITFAPKKDGTKRFCVDYRKVNAVTKKDAHPLPNIREIFDRLGGAKIFSTLDLKSGYWQIPIVPEDKPKSAFTTHLGLFEYNRLPFGLCNAPSQFQRIMNFALNDLIGKCVLVYIDDLLIYSKNVEEHAKHLNQVLERIKKYGMTLKAEKCEIGKKEVRVLGHVISAEGISPQNDKIKAIQELAPPTTVKQVRSFLGMVGYYRPMIPRFADCAEPLTKLTRKGEPFIWGPEQNQAFQCLKNALISPPILAFPDITKPYILHTDASDKAIGAILTQELEGKERVIAYLSHQLSSTQKRWAAIEKEAYAVVYALDHLKEYLWGANFVIYTDHKPLTSLFRAEIRNTKVQRWAIQISEFGAPIKYRPGKHNIRADMLSRISTIKIQSNETLNIPPEDYPLPWKRFGLDPNTMAQDQKAEQPDCWKKAETEQEGYVIKHGYLYSQRSPTELADEHLRLVLPSKYQSAVLEAAHHDCGHQSIKKTLETVRENFVWPGMRRAVEKYVQTCPLCAIYYQGKAEKQPGRMPIPPRPLHTWGLDLIGPFSPAQGTGNRYVLTAIDHYTGWAEAVPIRDKTNEAVWDAFMSRIVAQYGLPEVLITDQGKEFAATEFISFMREVGIDHRRTTAYHPQTNGRTERFNGSLKRILAKLVKNDLPTWEKCLPQALWAYRTASHVTLGTSPYKALYGMAPRQPQQPTKGQPMGERLRQLHQARKLAHDSLTKSVNVQWRKRQVGARDIPVLHPNDPVLLKCHVGPALQSQWEPGWTCIKVEGPVVLIQKDTELRRVNREKLRLAPPGADFIELNPRKLRRERLPLYQTKTGEGLKITLKKISGVNYQSEWNDWLTFVSNFGV